MGRGRPIGTPGTSAQTHVQLRSDKSDGHTNTADRTSGRLTLCTKSSGSRFTEWLSAVALCLCAPLLSIAASVSLGSREEGRSFAAESELLIPLLTTPTYCPVPCARGRGGGGAGG